jgi:hypothetical protein
MGQVMQEAEALCSRIGIVVGGKLVRASWGVGGFEGSSLRLRLPKTTAPSFLCDTNCLQILVQVCDKSKAELVREFGGRYTVELKCLHLDEEARVCTIIRERLEGASPDVPVQVARRRGHLCFTLPPVRARPHLCVCGQWFMGP